MASRQPSLLARMLEPLSASLWILFLVWTVIVAVVWIFGFGAAELHERLANPGLRDALTFLLGSLDAVWITLAAVNGYLALAQAEGLTAARRWTAIVLTGAWLVAAFSSGKGFPLGPIRYTARLGMRLGPVPFALPLLWFAFVCGARSFAMRLAPRASHTRIALAAGGLTALTEANLEPLAWRARALWLWQGFPSWQNHAAWFAASFVFAFLLRETRVAATAPAAFPRPAVVLLIFNAVFLLTHAARFLQR